MSRSFTRRTARRTAVGLAAAVALGTGSAAWAATSASAAPASAAVPGCTAANLAVWVNLAEAQGAAGTFYYPLEFTNISGHACATGAYPGVSAMGPTGGNSATRPAATRSSPAGW